MYIKPKITPGTEMATAPSTKTSMMFISTSSTAGENEMMFPNSVIMKPV